MTSTVVFDINIWNFPNKKGPNNKYLPKYALNLKLVLTD